MTNPHPNIIDWALLDQEGEYLILIEPSIIHNYIILIPEYGAFMHNSILTFYFNVISLK